LLFILLFLPELGVLVISLASSISLSIYWLLFIGDPGSLNEIFDRLRGSLAIAFCTYYIPSFTSSSSWKLKGGRNEPEFVVKSPLNSC